MERIRVLDEFKYEELFPLNDSDEKSLPKI